MTVYFPNWNIRSDSRAQVRLLPWDRLEGIHHAFWKIAPRDGGFALVPVDPWADLGADNPLAHFPQYAACAERYPDVKIRLSVGGWTACGCFSEMALTEAGRASFIRSCLETLDAYPFFSGLDLDWEYPGVARPPEPGNEGNPVAGDDRTGYTRLLRELRVALDGHFGPGRRSLTVCAGAGLSTLAHQDYAALHPFVDRIHLMTYDLAGPWDPRTGHHTALYGGTSADAAVRYLLGQGVPAEKIAIGSPLYGHGWKTEAHPANPVGAPAEGLKGRDPRWRELHRLEEAAVPEGVPGWHAGYDPDLAAAWLRNDDPASGDDRNFYTYESAA